MCIRQTIRAVVLFGILLSAHAEDETLIVNYPETWGKQTLINSNVSECPELSGKYFDDGEGYAELQGAPSDASMNGTLRVKVNSILDFKNSPNISELVGNYIFIEQNNSELKVSIPSKTNNKQSDSYLLKKVNNDYVCRDNWLSIQETKYTIGAESSHRNYREVVRLTKLADGSLLIFKDKYVKATSIWYLGLGDYVNTFRIYAKYKPVDK